MQAPIQLSTAGRIARPQGRARIETIRPRDRAHPSPASPGLKAGRGLKLTSVERQNAAGPASPGLKAGRGLKLQMADEMQLLAAASPGLKAGRGLKRQVWCGPAHRLRCIARPQGRARIETDLVLSHSASSTRIARPQGRARIETMGHLIPLTDSV